MIAATVAKQAAHRSMAEMSAEDLAALRSEIKHAPKPEAPKPEDREPEINLEEAAGGLAKALEIELSQAWTREPLSEFPPDELGQAQAFARYLGNRIQYTPGLGWLAFDDSEGRWRDDVAETTVFFLLGRMARQRSDLRDATDREAAAQFAKKAPTYRSLAAVAEILKRSPGIWRDPNAFDADPCLLNCLGTAVDLRTGKTRPARARDLFTRTTGVRPMEGAAPEFERFLNQVCMGRGDLSAWILRWFGYSLSGDTSAPFFVNFWGGGRNGKGALMRLIRHIFGRYACAVAASVVVDDSRISGPRPEIVDLMGPRLGEVAEVPPGKLSVETIKQLTGSDPITAARKFRDPIEFVPRIKLTLVSNHRLEVPHVDVATSRRFKLVPFDYEIPEGAEDPDLEVRLRAEAPAVLALLIREAQGYFKGVGPRGFPPCETIERASSEYLASEDLIGRWLEERTIRIGTAPANLLYKDFAAWAEREGIQRPPKPRTFGEELVSRKIERRRNAKYVYYVQISLRDEDSVYVCRVDPTFSTNSTWGAHEDNYGKDPSNLHRYTTQNDPVEVQKSPETPQEAPESMETKETPKAQETPTKPSHSQPDSPARSCSICAHDRDCSFQRPGAEACKDFAEMEIY